MSWKACGEGGQYQLPRAVYTHHLLVSLRREFFLGECLDVCTERRPGMFIAGLFIIGEIEKYPQCQSVEDLNKRSTFKLQNKKQHLKE